MIKIPVNTIIEKINEKTGLSTDEINSKIKAKLDQLSGLISEEGAAHIISNELGVKLFDAENKENLKIKDVYAGMRNVELNGKVTAKYEVREFNSNGRQGKVGSFMIGDETGRMRITCWGSMADKLSEFSDDDIVKVKNGFAKENNNRVEVHLNDNSIIEVNPEGVKIEGVKAGFSNTRKSINDIQPGEENIEILATIVQSYDPNFWEVCPTCNKKVKNEDGVKSCNEHGEVTPDLSYVMNCFLDDGTDSVRTVFFKNQIQNLLGKNHQEILDMKETGFEDMKNDLLGKIISVIGRVTQNEMFARKEFIAQVVNANPDPKKELKSLEAEKSAEETSSSETIEETSSSKTDVEKVAEKTEAVSEAEVPKEEPVTEEVSSSKTENVVEETTPTAEASSSETDVKDVVAVEEESSDVAEEESEVPTTEKESEEDLLNLDDLEPVDDDKDIYS